jgi:triacylglycerol lipase
MEKMQMTRRGVLQTGLGLAGGAGLRPASAQAARLPVVFVHGNGDTAGLWISTFWRFEQNGWPRELLHAVDLRYPNARGVDAVPQPLSLIHI